MEKAIKCPYCGGEMLVANVIEKIVCEYCDEVFSLAPQKGNQPIVEVNNIQQEPVVSEVASQTPAQRLFRFHTTDFESEDSNETWTALCKYLNAGLTNYQYRDFFDRMAIHHATEMAAAPHTKLYKVALERVSAHLEPNEEFVFYKDSGVFSKGKEGQLITSKKIYFIKKKTIVSIALQDIKSLHNTWLANAWFFNSDRGTKMDGVNCTNEQLGIILAYVMTKVQSIHTNDYTIDVYKENL